MSNSDIGQAIKDGKKDASFWTADAFCEEDVPDTIS
jgi:hypothetical protein